MNVNEGILVMDLKGIIIWVNLVVSCIYGYFLVEILGKNLSVFFLGWYFWLFYKVMWKDFNEIGEWLGELWNRWSDGVEFV